MSINQKIAPNLYLISTLLEDNRVDISANWVKVSTVKSVFETRKISIKKF